MNNLTDLFYLEILTHLNENNLSFKENHYANGFDYYLCQKDESSLIITLDFLQSNDKYFQSLYKKILPNLLNNLLEKNRIISKKI